MVVSTKPTTAWAQVNEQGDLVILMDEFSASASEIVSGAIQDLDRGIIVGRRSFGKGLVQRPFQLPDSSEVRRSTRNSGCAGEPVELE